jgi:hypothetical protein
MIQGWCLSPARIHVQGASGSWIVLPCVPAARPLRVTGDRLRRQDDEPRPACTCVQKCQCHCGLEDPGGGRRVSGLLAWLATEPSHHRTGHPVMDPPSRHYAGALLEIHPA